MAQAFEARALEDFHWLHRHPETALCEAETTAYIMDRLRRIEGVQLLELGLPTGALARVSGPNGGPVIAVRADIDALPMGEESGLAYASENPGRMHACGHDFHTAALLTLARLLAEKRETLAGDVVLLFQPAEEAEHGGQRVVETGFLAREGIEKIFALHVTPQLPVGAIAVTAGPFSAAVDRFYYKITGLGGHASAPQRTLDPILAAARLVEGIQGIVSRRVPPTLPAVVSVTRLNAGTTWNIIPESAEIEGTARSFHASVRDLIAEGLAREAEAIRARGYQVDFQWLPGCPATDNDPELARRVADTAREMGFQVTEDRPDMGGEDFSCYQEKIPGALFHVGTGGSYGVHHPKFIADPAALFPAAKLMERVVLRTLEAR